MWQLKPPPTTTTKKTCLSIHGIIERKPKPEKKKKNKTGTKNNKFKRDRLKGHAHTHTKKERKEKRDSQSVVPEVAAPYSNFSSVTSIFTPANRDNHRKWERLQHTHTQLFFVCCAIFASAFIFLLLRCSPHYYMYSVVHHHIERRDEVGCV